MTLACQTIHPWEKAGLGTAPYRLLGMERKVYQASPESPVQPGGCCDYCSQGIHYQFFVGSADGKRFKVGSDCIGRVYDTGAPIVRQADRLLKAEKRRQKAAARQAALAAREAQNAGTAEAWLQANGLAGAWAIYSGPASTAYEERTIADIVGKLVRYGSITERTADYARALLAKIPERATREAAKAAEEAAAQPLPAAGRYTIRGEVLKIKCTDGPFPAVKMLVKAEQGWKVWGRLPAALDAIEAGVTVEFSAAIEPSHDDPKFGFFSRPTKARVIEQAAATVAA